MRIPGIGGGGGGAPGGDVGGQQQGRGLVVAGGCVGLDILWWWKLGEEALCTDGR